MLRTHLKPQLRAVSRQVRPAKATFSQSIMDLEDTEKLTKRSFASSLAKKEREGGMTNWPRCKPNTLANICPQGERHVIERFGKLLKVRDPGLYFQIPFIDKVSYRVDMREKAVSITPQTAISRDNVSINISGVVYAQFIDAEKAAYGHFNPLYAMIQHAQSAMRSAVGNMEMDQLFHDRLRVNKYITEAIAGAAEAWGIKVLRYEVTDIKPDERISNAMDKQAAAERIRREQVLEATGAKESIVLRSEGQLISRTNEAEAKKREYELHAEGEARSMLLLAKAKADAIRIVAEQLESKGGRGAASLIIAKDYMEMMGHVGSKSNTMFFNQNAGDFGAMVAQLATTWRTASSNLGESLPESPPPPPSQPAKIEVRPALF